MMSRVLVALLTSSHARVRCLGSWNRDAGSQLVVGHGRAVLDLLQDSLEFLA